MAPFRRLALLFALLSPAAASAQGLVSLAGHVSPRIKTAKRLGPVAPGTQLELSLAVKVDQGLLDRTLAQIMAQPPQSRHYLTHAEFLRLFDVAGKRQALKAFAQANGLTVDAAHDDPNSTLVRVSGSVAAIDRAFGIQLNNYQDSTGRVFRAHETQPLVPASITPHLNAVLGLSTADRWSAHLRRPSAARPALSGTHGLGGGLSPSDIKTVYGLSGSLNGSGQSIAIVELDGYNPSDIAAYENEYSSQLGGTSLAPTFIGTAGHGDTAPSNECGAPGQFSESDPGQEHACDPTTLAHDTNMYEVALDIELVIALAPSASSIRVYTSRLSGTDADYMSIFDQIFSDDISKTVSTSWGEAEADSGSSLLDSENTVFEEMAAQGQSVFAAAGDHGIYDDVANPTTISVDDPGSQPYVTAVGGTSLSGTVGGSISESVWNDTPGCDSNSSCWATGGGVSSYWTIPSFQNGVSGIASSSYRNTPDVALNADPDAAPYSICVGGTSSTDCSNQPIGGTSCAAPLWAALTALINQNRASLGYSQPLGLANAAIYQLAQGSNYSSAFRDITSGGNGGYSAGTGYDNATGWGSFKANSLIQDINGLSTPAAAAFTQVGLSSVTANWIAAAEPTGTTYTAQMSTAPFPNSDSGNVSSTTANTSVLFGTGGCGSPLAQATTYYFEVQASSNGSTSSFASLGSDWTLAAAPNSLSLVQVFQSSITLSFGAGSPVANPAGTVYRVDYWQPTGSTSSFYTTSANPALQSLAQGATYTLTVGALNAGGALAASGLLVSTVTIAETVSAPVVMTSTGGTISLHPPSGVITLTAPAGALTQPTSVTLSLPTCSLSAAVSAAGNLKPTDVCVQVDAGGIEPVGNTTLSMGYSPGALGGADPKELIIARFDPVDNVWVPLPSSVDAAGQTVTAATSHWSLFQVMANAPSASVSSAIAFPNPWRVSQGPSSMTFSQLPSGARLRIYTLTGLIVKDFSADDSGLASWDGTNESGRQAASGFYFLLIQGQGGTQTLKLAIQR